MINHSHRPVVCRVDPFPWRVVAYLVAAEVVVAWMAWRTGALDWWVTRMVVLAEILG